ncbi:hypothetical protein KCU79_g22584, partial [Aureobasidium melanogenum]
EDDDEEDEDADADQDDDESEIVGAVKRAPTRSRTSRARKSRDIESSDDDDSASDGDNDSDSSDESAATQAPWEKESDTAQEQDQDIVTDSTCVYCGQDEENDPSDEYEEYLECGHCGDHAHKQCARNANSLSSDQDKNPQSWLCHDCVHNGFLAVDRTTINDGSQRRSSVPKLARDLLPAARGGIKPNSHSETQEFFRRAGRANAKGDSTEKETIHRIWQSNQHQCYAKRCSEGAGDNKAK